VSVDLTEMNLRLSGFILYGEKEKAFSISQKTPDSLINIIRLEWLTKLVTVLEFSRTFVLFY
jgi:hypothetical protein